MDIVNYDMYGLLEKAIEDAFDGKMNLDFYSYLKSNKVLKREVEEFIESTVADEISCLVTDLED